MRVCILGSTGLLGKALMQNCAENGRYCIGVARKNADVNIDIADQKEMYSFFTKNTFDVVINTVAIVDHYFCDTKPDLAYLINARPSAFLVNFAKEFGFKYVFISTDGYFMGDTDKKHDENAPVFLLNEYARTKYMGEKFTLLNENALVVRTNIVGFRGFETSTFLEWAIDTLCQQSPATLFTDYFTSSITTTQFSKALFDLLTKDATGLYNIASKDVFSKAKFIEKLALALHLPFNNISLGSVKNLNSVRAESLGLDVHKAEKLLNYSLPTLDEVIAQIQKEYLNV